MDELGTLAASLPQISLPADTVLLREGERTGTLYVLVSGALRVAKHGTTVAVIDEPGACAGEISALLDIAHSADVITMQPSVVARLDGAASRLATDAPFALSLARMLAARLQLMTTYLVDLKQQYADEDGNLGMVDAVLSSLVRHSGQRTELGSERDPDPQY